MAVVLMTVAACSMESGLAATRELTCGSQLRFDEADLIAPVGVTNVDGASDALHAFLTADDATHTGLPTTGWRRVADTGDEALFIADAPSGGLMMVTLSRGPERWSAVEWGTCLPRPVHTDLDVAVWDLAAEPLATSSEIPAVVAAGYCAGDGPLDTRLQPPSVVYGSDSITVTLWVTSVAPRSDVSACVGGPFTPITIALTELIGSRVLRDGSEFPARLVQVRAADVDPGLASPGPVVR